MVKLSSRIVGLFMILCFLFYVTQIFAYECRWEKQYGGLSEKISCLEYNKTREILYAGTENGLFLTKDFGKMWEKIDTPAGVFQIKDIALTEKDIFILTDNNVLYRGDSNNWKRLNFNGEIDGLASFSESSILAWSGKKLFKLKKRGWEEIGREFIKDSIIDCVWQKDVICVMLKDEVLFSFDNGETWKRTSIKGKNAFLNEEDDDETIDEEDAVYKEGKVAEGRIAYWPEKGIVGVFRGESIFVIDPKTLSYNSVSTTFIKGKHLNSIAIVNGKVIVAGGSDIFVLFLKEDVLEKVDGAYIREDSSLSILDVQKIAVEYAEVSPEKIKRWRDGAKWKAVMPKVSVGFSESIDDNTEIYTNASTSYAVVGPRERDYDWDIDLTWDLADLVWNDAQTNIDVRSRLMVQLREDVLEEVTRLYFERKRLLAEITDMIESKGNKEGKILEKKIKLEEITAHIDAYTGGEFSASLKGLTK